MLYRWHAEGRRGVGLTQLASGGPGCQQFMSVSYLLKNANTSLVLFSCFVRLVSSEFSTVCFLAIFSCNVFILQSLIR